MCVGISANTTACELSVDSTNLFLPLVPSMCMSCRFCLSCNECCSSRTHSVRGLERTPPLLVHGGRVKLPCISDTSAFELRSSIRSLLLSEPQLCISMIDQERFTYRGMPLPPGLDMLMSSTKTQIKRYSGLIYMGPV